MKIELTNEEAEFVFNAINGIQMPTSEFANPGAQKAVALQNSFLSKLKQAMETAPQLNGKQAEPAKV